MSKRWTIGRSRECDVVVDVSEVSSRHCCLYEVGGNYFLEDLGSSNGTYINGERITGRHAVSPSDRILLGKKTPFPWPGASSSDEPKTALMSSPRAAAATPREIPVADPAGARTVRIGRSRDNEFVLDHAGVSARHACLIETKNGYRIRDLNSSNGVAIGHPHNRVTEAALTANDVVYFGTCRVPAAKLIERLGDPDEPDSEVAQASPAAIADGETIIGRSPECGLVLKCPMVSSQHARILKRGSLLRIEDLGSSNGTFLNHRRIHEPELVRPGDSIGMGSFTFSITEAGSLELQEDRDQVTIEACGVGIRVPGKHLIDDCSLTIYPTEIVGLMGPSGAGKTTLMRALNGYTPPTEGQVLLNGDDLYKHFDRYRAYLGYVPQDDIIHGDLTVFQALYFSARLRLPPDFTSEEIGERVRNVLKQLHLEGTENVLIGSPEKKGISGGQRKRVNLAMELLTDPCVLFLDEPTSGLSSEDARVVMKVLRELADEGKTILITIHQPGLDVYKMLDNLVIVGKDVNSPAPGRILYYGPAFPDALQFFNPDCNEPVDRLVPDMLFDGLKKRPAADWRGDFKESTYCREFVEERAGQSSGGGIATDVDRPKSNSRVSLQWRTLTARGLAIKLRDRMNTFILLAQAPVVAILLVLVFGTQATAEVTITSFGQVAGSVGTSLFLMGMAALWFGASNAVREIVGEWAIYRRERMVNLRIPAYLASKFTVLGILSTLQCVILLAIAYPGCGMKASWLGLFSYLLVASFVGIAIGLTLSAVAKTSEVAIGLLPIVLLAMVILGGAMMPMQDMNVFPRTIALVNPARWAFEGLVVTEAKSRPTSPMPIPPHGGGQPRTADMADGFFSSEKYRWPAVVPMIVLLTLFTLVVTSTVGILMWRDRIR